MAYNYLDIVNKVLLAFNEVTLTSSNFASSVGFQTHVQNSVNSAINAIYYSQLGHWPFARTVTTQTLTVPSGVPTVSYYTLPALCENADWDSFYIKNTTIGATSNVWTNINQQLPQMDLDQYRKYRKMIDQMQPTSTWDSNTIQVPRNIVRLDNNTWTITPVPSQAFVVEYDYYAFATQLSAYGDVPAIPAIYNQVIQDGTLMYCYMFRDNSAEAELAEARFQKGIDAMTRELIPSPPYARFND